MTKSQISFIRWANYSSEVASLFVFLLPAYLSIGSYPPVFIYILTSIVAAVIYTALDKAFNSTKITILSLPLLVAFSLIIGWHWFFAIGLPIILIWRLIVLRDDYYPQIEPVLSIITLLFGVIIYSIFKSTEHIYLVIILVVLHLLGTSFIRVISSIFSSEGYGKRKELIKVILLHVFLAAAMLNSKLLYPLTEAILRTFAKGIAQVAGIVSKPLLPSSERPAPVSQETESFEVEQGESFVIEDMPPIKNINSTVVLIVIITILVLLIIYFLAKRKKNAQIEEYTEFDGNNPVMIEKIPSKHSNDNRQTRFTIKNPVRRYLHGLEKNLAKKGDGRRYDQTVEDWLSTLQTDEVAKAVVIQNYQKVRYGDFELSKEDLSAYKDAISVIKKQSKAAHN